jgi:hypothetical protein
MELRVGRRLTIVLLLLVLALAVALRFWGIGWGLYDAAVQRRAHPDEWPVYWAFRWFTSERGLDPCPSPGSQCFFDWGSVYLYGSFAVKLLLLPILDLLGRAQFGPQVDLDFLRSVMAARVTSAAASVLTVYLVYRLGRSMYGVATGLLAACILALAALSIQLGHFADPDSFTILLMTASLYACFLAIEQSDIRRFALAGVLIGAAAASEYHMALLGIPLLIAWRMGATREPRSLGIAIACAAGAWLVLNAYALVHLGAFVDAMLHTLRIRTVDSGAQYQGRFDAYGPPWLYVVRYPLGYGVGFALAVWLVLGCIWALVQHRRAEIFLLGWIVPYWLLVTLSPAKFMRYSAPLLPALALLAAGMAVYLLGRYGGAVRLTTAAVVVVALLLTFTYDVAYIGLFTRTDAREVAATWLRHNAAPGSEIEYEQLPNGLLNMPYFLAGAGYPPCFSQFRPGHLDGSADFVVLDQYSLEEHPDFSRTEVLRFRAALQRSPHYRKVLQVRYEPTVFGLTFPIDGSPHDWRYVAHDITVYRHLDPSRITSPYCYPSLGSAKQALYIPPQNQ